MTELPKDDVRLVDLSIGIESGVASEPWPPNVDYMDHKEGAEFLAENLRGFGAEITADDFPDGIGLAWEEVHAITHAGTHLDAPWHYGPTVDGEPSKTIDEIPLEWCHGPAVVLDFTEMAPGSEIAPGDVDEQLDDIDHTLSPGEIVLIRTGADQLWGNPEYLTEFPGMGAGATQHIVDQGVRVIGTDAYGFDKPFKAMADRYSETGDTDELWPAHFVGREVEYCQIEKMANLHRLPEKGFSVAAFPVKVQDASAGWVRPVAFVEE